MAVEALHLVVAASQKVEQQTNGRTLLIRPAMFAIDIVGQEHALGFLGLEMAIEEFAEAPGEERDHFGGFAAADVTEPFQEPPAFAQSAQPGGRQIRRRL